MCVCVCVCVYVSVSVCVCKCQNISTSEFLLIYTLGTMFGPPQLHFSKLSGEVSDLKLSKNVKVMFIFNAKLVC